jgi:hypothetical protein
LALKTLKGSTGFFRNLGSDYLNVEFGWKPFIRDIQNAAMALYSAQQQLSIGGKRVHRRYGLPTQRVVEQTQGMGQFALGQQEGVRPVASWFNATTFKKPTSFEGVSTSTARGQFATYGSRMGMKSVQRNFWFEGSFTSFMPLNYDPSDYLDRLNALVNVNITPEVLWNLAPWTWLVDWNLRISDSISANLLAANDLLIMHYGYAMEKTVYTTVSNSYGVQGAIIGANSQPNRVISSVVTTRKRRIRANPYGFRVGGAAALSGSQLAILAALGLTKLK